MNFAPIYTLLCLPFSLGDTKVVGRICLDSSTVNNSCISARPNLEACFVLCDGEKCNSFTVGSC